MYKIDIVSKITENISKFRNSEKRVASIILDDLIFAASASITQLSKKADVSEATVTRFAKAVGCKDVRDLKFQLVQAISIGERFVSEINVAPSNISSIYESIHRTLDMNANLITQEDLGNCVNLITRAKKIFSFGVGGNSTLMALEIQYRLFRLGLAITAYSDPMLMRMVAATIDKNDVIICFSLGSHAYDIEDAIEIAQQYGGSIISVSQQDVPIAKLADVNLPIAIRESDNIFKPSASRYAMLAVIDVLATEVAIQNKRASREKLRRLKHTLDQYRQSHDKLPLGD